MGEDFVRIIKKNGTKFENYAIILTLSAGKQIEIFVKNKKDRKNA